MAWWMAAIPIAMSVLKSQGDKKRHEEMQKAEAVKERWSPWTGQHGQSSIAPDTTGTIMQGVSAGMGMAQNYDDYQDRKAMRHKYMDTMGLTSAANDTGPGYTGSAVPSTSGYQGRSYPPSGGNLDITPRGGDYDIMMNQNPSHRNWVPEGPSRF